LADIFSVYLPLLKQEIINIFYIQLYQKPV
jgi:hypothetical protein